MASNPYLAFSVIIIDSSQSVRPLISINQSVLSCYWRWSAQRMQLYKKLPRDVCWTCDNLQWPTNEQDIRRKRIMIWKQTPIPFSRIELLKIVLSTAVTKVWIMRHSPIMSPVIYIICSFNKHEFLWHEITNFCFLRTGLERNEGEVPSISATFCAPCTWNKNLSDLPLCMEAYIFNDKNDNLFEITPFLLFE